MLIWLTDADEIKSSGIENWFQVEKLKKKFFIKISDLEVRAT